MRERCHVFTCSCCPQLHDWCWLLSLIRAGSAHPDVRFGVYGFGDVNPVGKLALPGATGRCGPICAHTPP